MSGSEDRPPVPVLAVVTPANYPYATSRPAPWMADIMCQAEKRGMVAALQLVRALAFNPSCEDVWNACLSYRHDAGLLPDDERQALECEAKAWLRAWGQTMTPAPSERILSIDPT